MSARKPDIEKKKPQSFSTTATEMEAIDRRAEDHHGFKDRNEYLFALVEADEHYKLQRVIQNRREVLRLPRDKSPIEEALEERTAHDEWRDDFPSLNEAPGKVSSVIPKNKSNEPPSGGASGGTGKRS